MSAETAKVSIGLPVYNGEQHIAAALESLLAQDHGDLEIHISDNASTDATGEICRAFAQRDPRISFSRNEHNLGATKNFARVLALASSPYFMFAGHHDLWAPTFVSRCLAELERDPGVVLCYPQARWIGDAGETLDGMPPMGDTRGLDPVARLHVTLWQGHGFLLYGLMRAEALRSTSLGLGVSAVGGDLVVLGELALLGEFALVPEVLHFARRGADFGDWRRYLERLSLPVTRTAALRLYLDLVRRQLRTVVRGVGGWRRKPLATLSVLLCMLLRYEWVLRGMRSAAGGER